MPELPEVETVARQLQPLIRGRRLRSVEILDPRLGSLPTRALVGARVERVFRLGKQVVLELQRRRADLFLAVHLRMSGRLCWQPGRAAAARHLRARLRLEGGSLLFCDPRRFGTLGLHRSLDEIRPAGIDPLSRGFTARTLAELLEKSVQQLKVWLLRQDRLVGLGNIYASEILFQARLHPCRRANALSPAEIQRLHRATRDVLRRAIACCGTTFSDFQDARGLTGSFGPCLAVYGREDEPCRSCGATVQRIVQGQRSTYFCPRCQPG